MSLPAGCPTPLRALWRRLVAGWREAQRRRRVARQVRALKGFDQRELERIGVAPDEIHEAAAEVETQPDADREARREE